MLVEIHTSVAESPRGSFHLLDDHFIVFPQATRHPESTIDNLGISLVRGFDGGKHAETVSSTIDILRLAWTEQGIEDIGRAGQRSTSSHLKAR